MVQADLKVQIEYRLSTFPEVCFGLFLRGEPSLPVKLPNSIPYLAEAPVSEDAKLVAHTLATKSASRVVRDKDMELPSAWKTDPQAGSELGHDPNGKTIAQHSLSVSPGYQNSGLGKAIMRSYITRMKEAGQADRISLLAHDYLVPYYESLGFKNLGKSESAYAGATWYDLVCSNSLLYTAYWLLTGHQAYEFAPSSAASA